jgi:hypothetical protein
VQPEINMAITRTETTMVFIFRIFPPKIMVHF